MLRKLMSWNVRNHISHKKSGSSTRRRRANPLRGTILGVEWLESREMLNASPVLSIPANQFFGAGLSRSPFHATFTDVRGTDPQFFSYSIDWGDGSPIETGDQTLDPPTLQFKTITPFGQLQSENDQIVGRIRLFHTFPASAVIEDYDVSVILNDGTFSHTAVIPVDVYPVDGTLAVGELTDPLDVNEGQEFSLTVPATSDTNKWRINWGDGIETFEFVDAPTSLPHTYADDFDIANSNVLHPISAAVFKADGIFYAAGDYAKLVHDVPTEVSVTGGSTVPEDATYTLTLNYDDVPADPAIAWVIDWGDGNVVPVPGDQTTVSHEYENPGNYNIFAFAVHDDLGLISASNASFSNPFPVTVTDVPDDGVFLTGSTLSVIDSNAANDIVTISQSNGEISVSSNGGTPFVFSASAVNRIEVVLGTGHDIVVVGSNILVPLTIDGGGGNDLLVGGGGRSVLIGGAGNDILWGGAGDDVLLGGDGNDDLFGGGGNDALVGGFGNDFLFGGAGRDLLIGSQDEDLLHAGNGEDILIGGHTSHDNDIDALDAIMATWGSTDGLTARVETLTGDGGLLDDDAVFDDGATDIIIGGAGRDLVFGDTNPADGVFDILALNPIQDRLVTI